MLVFSEKLLRLFVDMLCSLRAKRAKEAGLNDSGMRSRYKVPEVGEEDVVVLGELIGMQKLAARRVRQ